ncbi:MAG: hypothetical protein H0W61_00320 [Bacteroidetes bacterium]|nr:hypothetical protein [Bacteroidota bacterium]
MALEKVLHKIQIQVKELAPTLELFIDDSIQPSVTDCETLQHQINQLAECLAVYKFQKKEKEISPSFNIHAKVSEKETVISAVREEIKSEKKTEVAIPKTEKEPANEIKLPPLTFGINDKFRFINELFKQNNSEYNIALEQLSSLATWADAEIYLASLKDLYDWKDNEEVVVYFYSLIKKRYS